MWRMFYLSCFENVEYQKNVRVLLKPVVNGISGMFLNF